MIIAKITGGLGNQLFQYAFVKSLSLKLDEKFKLDLSWYRDYHKYEESNNPNSATKRKYLLDKFRIEENLLSPMYMTFNYKIKNSRIFGKYKNCIPFNYFSYTTISEKDFNIDRIQSNKNVYLTGVWQKSALFEEYSELLQKEFTLKTDLTIKNQIILDKINSTNSVAIHIRRGDLLSRPNAVLEQPYSSNSYYVNALKTIKISNNNIEVFIFSDDIDWAKTNLDFGSNINYVDTLGPDYEHFRLMTHCKHQIIANSTYSWWAAWLNNYQDKMIISPKCWYRDPIKNESIIRIPVNWIILENLE